MNKVNELMRNAVLCCYLINNFSAVFKLANQDMATDKVAQFTLTPKASESPNFASCLRSPRRRGLCEESRGVGPGVWQGGADLVLRLDSSFLLFLPSLLLPPLLSSLPPSLSLLIQGLI